MLNLPPSPLDSIPSERLTPRISQYYSLRVERASCPLMPSLTTELVWMLSQDQTLFGYTGAHEAPPPRAGSSPSESKSLSPSQVCLLRLQDRIQPQGPNPSPKLLPFRLLDRKLWNLNSWHTGFRGRQTPVCAGFTRPEDYRKATPTSPSGWRWSLGRA